ncbi:ribonucleoside hydrolase RihC [Limihaloglobus sulfuriphilus]|uniref:Ribonucleoside hydrolase RihC n=1 Tax=Limihaloglobus sulfuriphilus TaxID=1851148 RepID=A0A1Q2MFT5_9BACT|nr:nucleoside hydrolase [Limihaloglobus sulfuriphilus]AQQ71157.1 ribonucleoside hydrolase RihC [Limihaloglobus sulfuriphilus]
MITKANNENYSQVKGLIIDTDLGNDIDDSLAMLVAYSLESAGECNILGVAVNKGNYYTALYADILNTFYGRSELEIGIARDGKTPNDGPFARAVAESKVDGEYKYPRSRTVFEMPAVDMYRKLLANAADDSVVIVSIGFLTNLAALLESGPDSYSELSGAELAAKKVSLLSVMAGNFSDVAKDECGNAGAEYNIRYDIPAAQTVCRHWPGETVFSGVEVGKQILYPARSIEDDFSWAEHHPVVDGYNLFKKMPYDRPTWDLTSVLYAVRPGDGYFDISRPGRVEVDDAGITHFKEKPHGTHKYLIVNPDKINDVKTLLVRLCSRNPETAQVCL